MRQIARALELDLPIGLVPLGTFNDLARTLAIPLDLAGACKVIASGLTGASTSPASTDSITLTRRASAYRAGLREFKELPTSSDSGLLAIAASALRALFLFRTTLSRRDCLRRHLRAFENGPADRGEQPALRRLHQRRRCGASTMAVSNSTRSTVKASGRSSASSRRGLGAPWALR